MYDVNFYRSMPDEFVSSSSGGGGVSTNATGAIVDPGTASGDTAAVIGPGYIGGFSRWSPPVATLRIWYSMYPGTSPTDNPTYIGFLEGEGAKRAALDITNGRFETDDGTTSSISFDTGSENIFYLEVTMDAWSQTADFYVEDIGGKDEGDVAEASLSGVTPDVYGNGSPITVCYTESGGSDEANPVIHRARLEHKNTGEQ